jgi:endonuclease-3
MPTTERKAGRRAAAPVDETLRRLGEAYPQARCSLDYGTPLELLIATILSAQCTDARVNMVTPELFRRFPDAKSLAGAPEGALEDVIKSTGFFNAKARSIRGAARVIVERHGGEVPRTMDELVKLPGVGRKTANVVTGNAFGEPGGVVVDTHVGRITRRLGWTRHTDPEKVETDLNRLVPRESWVFLPHALIHHGRAICTARSPLCESCFLFDVCPRVGVPARKVKTKAKSKARARVKPEARAKRPVRVRSGSR